MYFPLDTFYAVMHMNVFFAELESHIGRHIFKELIHSHFSLDLSDVLFSEHAFLGLLFHDNQDNCHELPRQEFIDIVLIFDLTIGLWFADQLLSPSSNIIHIIHQIR